MGRSFRIALAAVLGAAALAGSAGAFAHGPGRHDGYRGHGWGHHRHPHSHPPHRSHAAYRERVIVHRPLPAIYGQHAYPYYPQPALIIGVNIPPLVVQLR